MNRYAVAIILQAELRAWRNRITKGNPVRVVGLALFALFAGIVFGGSLFGIAFAAGEALPSARDATVAGGGERHGRGAVPRVEPHHPAVLHRDQAPPGLLEPGLDPAASRLAAVGVARPCVERSDQRGCRTGPRVDRPHFRPRGRPVVV